MAIETLKCKGFRNLRDTRVPFDEGLTVLLGDNGQGKTNLLEALYFLATTRSFRRATATEMIAHGGEDFEVRGTVCACGMRNRLGVRYGSLGILRFKDEKRVGLEEYIPVLKTVAISSSQMSIIDGSPEERRRFMDRGILSLFPKYLHAFGRYNHVRRQRNAALSNAQTGRVSSGANDTLEAWEEEFVKWALEVMSAREDFVARLKKKPRQFRRRSTGRKDSSKQPMPRQSGSKETPQRRPSGNVSRRCGKRKSGSDAALQGHTGTI